MRDYKFLTGYKGKYAATEDGRILSWQKNFGLRDEPRELARTLNNSGYMTSMLGSKRVLVHRLVLEAFVGPRPTADHQGCHKNGNRLDNRIENLCWKTRSENEADKRAHGTLRFGGRCYQSKLSDSKVQQIRRRLAGGEGVNALARQYGVAHSTIQRVRDRVTWRRVQI